jgi:hypothetical protein
MTWRSCAFHLEDWWSTIILNPSTQISIKSLRKDEFTVFRANYDPSTVKKVMADLRKLTSIVIFCYKRGCISTTVKLVCYHIMSSGNVYSKVENLRKWEILVINLSISFGKRKYFSSNIRMAYLKLSLNSQTHEFSS